MSSCQPCSAICLVCQRGDGWGVHLKQLLQESGITVRQRTRLEECWQLLEEHPSSILIVEAGPRDGVPVFGFVEQIQSQFPAARVIVALARGLEQEGWLLREAGAVHVVHSLREADTVARLVRRHIDRAPVGPMTLAQQILMRLPWN
jgi:DNA-binding response OmpR family regulator